MVQQLSVLFQIIEKAGTIPWDNIKLPADRTLLAAKKMINNEREKVTAMNNGEEPVSATKVANPEVYLPLLLLVLTCRSTEACSWWCEGRWREPGEETQASSQVQQEGNDSC